MGAAGLPLSRGFHVTTRNCFYCQIAFISFCWPCSDALFPNYAFCILIVFFEKVFREKSANQDPRDRSSEYIGLDRDGYGGLKRYSTSSNVDGSGLAVEFIVVFV